VHALNIAYTGFSSELAHIMSLHACRQRCIICKQTLLAHNMHLMAEVPGKEISRAAKLLQKGTEDLGVKHVADSRESDPMAKIAKTIRSAGLSLNVPISNVDVGIKQFGDKYPVCKPSDVCKALAEAGHLNKLFGGPVSTAKDRNQAFWNNFNHMYPQHQFFEYDMDWSLCVPCFVYADGGRTLKKDDFTIVMFEGAMGAGTNKSAGTKRGQKPIKKMATRQNLVHTDLQRCVSTCVVMVMVRDLCME
jgi:hypothetical protein